MMFYSLNLIIRTSRLIIVSGLFCLFLWSYILHVLPFDYIRNHVAYAHFFGSVKQIGNYQIVFQPLPFIPFANEDSTLNFSILDKNNANVNNVYASLSIKDKSTGKMIEQTPARFYEFSDISFPFKFRSNSNYMVTFEATLNGDPIYQGKSMIATFDLSVGNSPLGIHFDKTILFYAVPAAIVIPAGLAIYQRYKKKSTK